MDLNKIKQRADKDMVIDIELQNKKREAIEKFDTMFEIGKNSYDLWNERSKSAVDKFLSSFKKYFETNGFSVKYDNPFVENATCGNILIASYGSATFKLSAINHEGDHMYIQNFDENLCVEFWIGLPKNVPNYFVWKDNVTVSKKSTHQYGNNAKDGYKDFVDGFNTIEELNEVINKIDINIQHFNESIEKANDIELVIHKFGVDTEYKDFEEFWDSIE